MKATATNLLEFLWKSKPFAIPIYQRTYSWTEKECNQLWDDIIRVGHNNSIPGHFIGSIVYIHQGIYHVSGDETLLVIDGQQRLATTILIIEALARRLGDEQPLRGFSSTILRDRYLRDPHEDGEAAYKLLLTETDKQTLISIIDRKPYPAHRSHSIIDNFEFFKTNLDQLHGNYATLCKGLAKLIVVDIALNRDQDNPQLIFESMNSTGRELSQADLIRNFILMGLKPAEQTQLYHYHWRPMEMAFGQKAYATHFDAFMRYFLTVKTGNLPNIKKVYETFKGYSRAQNAAGTSAEDIVAEVHAYAGYYCAMELGQEPEQALNSAFADLRELKANVAYPLLLELYDDYANGVFHANDFEKAIRLVESYVFRRGVCSIPTNSMNRTFESFSKSLRKERFLESIEAAFTLMPTYRRFPDDKEFRRELVKRDLYNFPRRSYWLRRLENHQRRERVRVDDYTVEHIMPQNERLSTEWQNALGDNWREVHSSLLHTLGNLTLTGYNSQYSDKSFPEKRDMKGGFRESPLRVNQGLPELSTWNQNTIEARADTLADTAIDVWREPMLPSEVLEAYRVVNNNQKGTYTILDHRHLAPGKPARLLFDAFREAVIAIDPDVSEEVRKIYVSYKADTNFADVEAQAKQLKVWLNLPFHEIDDPRGLSRDVTNVGHHGIGDVELPIENLEQIPYAIGLVRQSFERQLDEVSPLE